MHREDEHLGILQSYADLTCHLDTVHDRERVIDIDDGYVGLALNGFLDGLR